MCQAFNFKFPGARIAISGWEPDLNDAACLDLNPQKRLF